MAIVNPSIQGALRDAANNDVWSLVGSGAPTNGTSGTGVGLAGPGSTYTDYTNKIQYINTNTKASPTWVAGATISGIQTLTNKTITGGTINAANTISGNIETDTKVLAANQAFTSNATLATLTGFSYTLIAGATYKFEINLPATMTTNGGLSVALKYTTATATSIQMQTYAATASDNTTAVSTQSTTTTDATKYFDSKAAAYTLVTLKGTLVCGTGGTVAIQACQNTSHIDTTTVLLGAYATFIRTL